MNKVAILTIFNNNNNYGGVLQSYALQKVVRQLGYDARVLVYVNGKNPIYPTIKERLKQYTILDIIKKSCNQVQEKVNRKKISNILEERDLLFNAFKREHIVIDGPYDDNTLVESQKIYDSYISGSDQIWNPNAVRNGFLLSMIDCGHKKIAYAASIGRSALSEWEIQRMIPLILRYDWISVREETAKKLLLQSGVNNVFSVYDPTFLLTVNEWQELCRNPEIEGRYVFCYFFSSSLLYRNAISKYCAKRKLKLVYLPYANQQYVNSDSRGEGIQAKKVGPCEFLGLIKNAECVFTDSFHGIVFSLIFQRPFVAFERDHGNSRVSKNSRIYDLLSEYRLQNRLCKEVEKIFDIADASIDYEGVEKRIAEGRKRSLQFLNNALNS